MKPQASPDDPTDRGLKIVALDRFRPRASLSPLRQAEAYWAALRQGAKVPARAAIDPRGLSNLLHYAFILERVAPGSVRFRLAGQHVTQMMDMEVSGLPLSVLFASADRDELRDQLTRLFDGPAIVELGLKGQRRFGRKMQTARMILLPLSSACGTVDRALGVVVSDGEAPRGFGRLQIETTRQRGIDPVSECSPETPQAPRSRRGFRLVPINEN